MRHLLLASVAFVAMTTGASANPFHGFHWFVPHYHHVAKPPVVTTPATPKASPQGGGSQNFTLCPTPAGIFICAVTAAIVVDEIGRAVAGPACATGKLTRKSYFGLVVDEPRLWRPLCKGAAKPPARHYYTLGK